MGDACENLHLARAVNRGGIVELAGETVEKAFEDEDGHPVRRERQDQREKGVEQTQIPHQQVGGDRAYHGRERHGGQEEQDDLVFPAHRKSRQAVGGEGIDGQRGQDGQQHRQSRDQDGAAALQQKRQHPRIVLPCRRQGKRPLVLQERHGIRNVEGRKRFLDSPQSPAVDPVDFRRRSIPVQEELLKDVLGRSWPGSRDNISLPNLGRISPVCPCFSSIEWGGGERNLRKLIDFEVWIPENPCYVIGSIRI